MLKSTVMILIGLGYSFAQAEALPPPRVPELPLQQCYFGGHTRLMTVPGALSGAIPVAGGRAILILRPDKKIQIAQGTGDSPTKFVSKKELQDVNEFTSDSKLTEVYVSPNGRWSLIRADETGYLIDSQKLTVTKIASDFDGGFFTENSRKIIVQSGDSVSLFDIAGKTLKPIGDVSSKSVVAMDHGSQNLFVVTFEKFPSGIKEVVWQNLKSNERRLLNGSQVSISNSSSKPALTELKIGSSVFRLRKPRWTRTQTAEIKVDKYEWTEGRSTQWLKFREGNRLIDLAMPIGRSEDRPTETFSDEFLVTSATQDDLSTLSIFDKSNVICAKRVKVDCIDCVESSGRERSIRAYTDQGAKFVDKTLCETPFNANDPQWKDFSPMLKRYSERGDIEKWLLRFSKKGGFKASENLGTLEGLLGDKDVVGAYGSLLALVMANVMAESTNLYSSLLLKYPLIRTLPPAAAPCISPEERQHLAKFAYPVLKRQLLLSQRDRPMSEYRYFAQFAQFLSDAEKDEFADLIGEAAARYTVQHDYRLQGIFFSKIYQFSYQNARRMMGLSYQELTDAVVGLRNGDSAWPMILGTSKISERSKLTEAGFYTEDGSGFQYRSNGPLEQRSEYEWSHAGKQYQVRMVGKAVPIVNEWVVTEPSIRFNELRSDGVLRGIVIAGSNLSISHQTLNEYKEYYEEAGFQFQKPIVLENFKDYLKDKVIGAASTDYMVKEAHSDGDDKNLFRMTNRISVSVGTRKSGGITEVIEIVYPDHAKGSELISNVEFGEWVRMREASKKGQLVYINSSCWSRNKAIAELAAAHSSVLVEIATTTAAYTFINRTYNALRIIIDSVRSNFSYEQMRTALQESPRYKKKESDVYIFPDEPEYKRLIVEGLRTPFDLTMTVFERNESTGQFEPYHFDQRIHQ